MNACVNVHIYRHMNVCIAELACLVNVPKCPPRTLQVARKTRILQVRRALACQITVLACHNIGLRV